MERVTLDFSLPNFITIGLIAAAWWLLIVGTGQLLLNRKNKAAA